ncbi:MAG: aminoglycoside phosphotransferase family protein [Bradyrhizobium sp.]|nr:aminoglycoside phosphotransferase family protein [Bradyrhizobium sp.]
MAQRLGVRRVEPVILHVSQHVSVRLFPLNVVARAVSLHDQEAMRRLSREIDIARHLVKSAAPIVGPAVELPPGPHVQDGFAFSLWEFVEHVAADDENAGHVTGAAEALHRLHQALATFPGELPDFRSKVDHCGRLLESEAALPALRVNDRDFLLGAFDRLRASLAGLRAEAVPIHGDTHLRNVFITADGVRWNDLEDVCLGSREWDISSFPEADLGMFEPINRDLLTTLGYLRGLCAVVWCSEKYDVPEKRDAAEYHLRYLRGLGLFRGV